MWRNAGRFMQASDADSSEGPPVTGDSESSLQCDSESAEQNFEESTGESSESADESSESPDLGERNTEATQTRAETTTAPSTLEITRRFFSFGAERNRNAAINVRRHDCKSSRDITALQELWDDYAARAGKLFSPTVWRLLHAVLDTSKSTQSKVLQVALDMLLSIHPLLHPNSKT